MPVEMEPGGVVEITSGSEFTTADPQVKLRFVEREIDGRKVRILQQAWVTTIYQYQPQLLPLAAVDQWTEWRDVPLVTE